VTEPGADGRVRAAIEAITPSVGGRFAAKRIAGDPVVVEADCFADGHDVPARACCGGARRTG
jgi:starch synthase (maltosyl-transferring)